MPKGTMLVTVTNSPSTTGPFALENGWVPSPLQLPLLTTLLGNVSFWVKNIQMINWIWHHNFFLFFGPEIMKLSSCFSGCIAMPFVIYLATSKSLPLNNILFNNKSSFSYVTWVKSCLSSVSWLSQWSVVNRLFLWWLFNNILAPAFSVTAFSCQLVGRTYGRWCARACR